MAGTTARSPFSALTRSAGRSAGSAHEILERTEGASEVVLLGIPTRGVPLARRLAAR